MLRLIFIEERRILICLQITHDRIHSIRNDAISATVDRFLRFPKNRGLTQVRGHDCRFIRRKENREDSLKQEAGPGMLRAS